MKRGKKAQLAVFVIIAVVVVAAGIGLFVLRGNSYSNVPENLRSDVTSINSLIEECVNQRATDAIRIVGLQGGYINLPQEYVYLNFSNVAYGYYDNKNILNSKSSIENEISNYIVETVPFCINSDISMNLSRSQVKTTIYSNSVKINTKTPVYISKNNAYFSLNKDYNFEIPIALGEMHDIANKIINLEIKDPNYIQVSYLAGLKYKVLVIPVNYKTVVYSITDDLDKNKVPYSFLFANEMEIE